MMVMEDMLKDFLLGEHLLLVGNQVSDIHKSFETFNLLLNYIPSTQKRTTSRLGYKSLYPQRSNCDYCPDPALVSSKMIRA